MNISLDLSNKSNVNLITDVGCGAELLKASFNSGVFNCEINLKGIKDTFFTEKARSELSILKKDMDKIYKDAISGTNERIL